MPAATLDPPLSDESEARRASFEREALIHLDAVYRAALRLARDAADADDLVQETMLRAYRGWDRYQRGTNAKGWLLTILRNAFIEEYRRRSTRRNTVDVDAIESLAPPADFFESLVDDEVVRAIDALPLLYREVVVWTDVEGLPYEETAKLLRVPIGTVKSRVSRARKLLRARLYRYAVSTGLLDGRRA
ncbi:MAG TPA: sigma-70 family RNA polymerase sigma factor [Gemmatimonadales bacterium]|nr:sigma-70 family RNA polymerase sigma factor [Gemmatimonadales bacterium]